ncbi:serine hydrolase domain-containing protein [Streptomyces antarcticus]|uniref:serine hydrolase domain-containing protein n=1 Tax=Streptomyces antarcticus TaxID=2996458 RepID=UPI0022703006|nr:MULTISPECIES: serine hydrolase domain-containing protein [unclassified Streptomyces]MCY0943005.1 serine hydrolase [Streptomyces sp. H34-AA3]MCZ4086312.1 serine hydrolase [Streptomyces sp. H34-S5]
MGTVAVVALAGLACLTAGCTPNSAPKALGPSASTGSAAATGTGEPTGTAVARKPLPADVERKLRNAVDNAWRTNKVPGVRVDVNVPGKGEWGYSVGAADLRTKEPIARDDKVRIASITKTFTGTAVLQLVRAGKLRLDDSLDTYVSWPGGGDITIRQLLNMTSGIYSYTDDPAWLKQYTAHPDAPFRTQDALDIARRHAPYFAPGKGIKYSDTNYVLLGDIVEKVGGKPLAEWMRADIARPLKLTATSYPTDSDIQEPFASGYTAGPEGTMADTTRSNPSYAAGAGAMLSNLVDLRVWAREVATGEKLLTPELQRQRLRFVPIATEPVRVAYGLGIASFDGWLGHNGTILGYNTAMFQDPKGGATVIVEMNRSFATLDEDHATELFLEIAKIITPET